MKGTIYILFNSVDDKIYIGSTMQRLNVRMTMHRAAARAGIKTKIYTHMRKVGVYKWGIEAIKVREVKNRHDLEKIEFKCMNMYPATLLLNTDTEYGRKSIASREKMRVSHSGRRGTIGKYKQNDNVTYLIRFFWQHWENDVSIQKSKSFSISKYGERGARKMAEAFRDTIYPITK